MKNRKISLTAFYDILRFECDRRGGGEIGGEFESATGDTAFYGRFAVAADGDSAVRYFSYDGVFRGGVREVVAADYRFYYRTERKFEVVRSLAYSQPSRAYLIGIAVPVNGKDVDFVSVLAGFISGVFHVVAALDGYSFRGVRCACVFS